MRKSDWSVVSWTPFWPSSWRWVAVDNDYVYIVHDTWNYFTVVRKSDWTIVSWTPFWPSSWRWVAVDDDYVYVCYFIWDGFIVLKKIKEDNYNTYEWEFTVEWSPITIPFTLEEKPQDPSWVMYWTFDTNIAYIYEIEPWTSRAVASWMVTWASWLRMWLWRDWSEFVLWWINWNVFNVDSTLPANASYTQIWNSWMSSSWQILSDKDVTFYVTNSEIRSYNRSTWITTSLADSNAHWYALHWDIVVNWWNPMRIYDKFNPNNITTLNTQWYHPITDWSNIFYVMSWNIYKCDMNWDNVTQLTTWAHWWADFSYLTHRVVLRENDLVFMNLTDSSKLYKVNKDWTGLVKLSDNIYFSIEVMNWIVFMASWWLHRLNPDNSIDVLVASWVSWWRWIAVI